ncbi:MAG TPA: SPFH domain-containing protein, partial [Azospirillaceae bacterium]|nr:SPFH domain-containing protein [Azospirillaceae bacterium]
PLSWLKGLYLRQKRNLLIVLLILMLAFTYFMPSIVIVIPAGHGGVMWKRFFGGTQLEPAYSEGLHLIFPWDRLEVYDLRLKEDTRSYDAIANDGLPVKTEITVRYRILPKTLAYLHQSVGSDYLNVLLVPEVGSVIREVISRYKADELYAQRRQRIQEETFDQLADSLMFKGVVGAAALPNVKKGEPIGYILFQDVLIRDVILPPALVSSIESKVQQDQLAQEYEFRLQREAFESQRKQIEAQGIRSFQDTVQAGLTENYLKWRGIEATLDLATSTNAKVVVVGGGQSGLPLILNVGDAPPDAPGRAKAAVSAVPLTAQNRAPTHDAPHESPPSAAPGRGDQSLPPAGESPDPVPQSAPPPKEDTTKPEAPKEPAAKPKR